MHAETAPAALPIRALLVGVNTYANPRITPLQGCVNDVTGVKDYLRDQLLLAEERITLLCDEAATYGAVISAFEQLIGAAEPDDQTLIYFSCHGSQAPAVAPEIESDGLDESLVLYDSRTEGVFDLLDKELGYLVEKLVQKGVYATVVLDACHSGSGTRGDDEPDQVRLALRDERQRTVEQVYGGREAIALAATRQTASDWVNPAQGTASYVLIAGCRDEQRSREIMLDGVSYGALSRALLDELRYRLRPTTTYADLHHVIRSRVRALVSDQEPTCEGAIDRLVFAAGYVRRQPPITLRASHHTRAEVELGAAQGLTVGSTLLAFAADGEQDAPALARLTVTSVGTTLSGADVELLAGAGLPLDARLRVERYAYYPAQLVWLDGPGLEGVRAAITGVAEGGSPHLELIEARPEADLVVRRQGDAVQILGGAGLPLIKDVAIAGPGPVDEARLADLAVQRLEHLSRYWFSYKLRPKPAEDTLAGLVRLELCRVEPTGLVPLVGDEAVVRKGDGLALLLTNLGDDPIYVSVWNFTADYAVQPLFPDNGGSALLSPGAPKTFPLGVQGDPPGGLAEAVELLKLFVTRQSTQAFTALRMDNLELRSLPKEADESELGQFLGDLSRGKRAIGGRVGAWSVVDLTVRLVNDPKSYPLRPNADLNLPDGVTLRNGSPLAAKVRIATRDQLSRGVDDEDLPAPPGIIAAPDLFEPVALAQTRGAASPALVLSVEGEPGALAAISEQTPLELDVPAALVGAEARLIAVAYDGENYYLVGGPRESASGATVAIEWLPEAVDEPADGQTVDRDLVRTTRLLFYKVTGKEIPDTGLRRARVHDGAVVYEAAGAVAPGSRVLLCIHGITDDTRGMVRGIGQRLFQELGYDLLLTYDYESYGTSVSDHANHLWAQFHSAGIRSDAGVHLDLLTHSMGGLVGRALIELDRGGDLVKNLVMAGTPNAGSPLAKAVRFGFALGSLGLSLYPGMFSKVAGWALKWIDGKGVGLHDLVPGTSLLTRLRNGRRGDTVRYYVLAGTNLPEDAESRAAANILARTLDAALDTFFGDREHDLVVAMSSMLTVERQPDAVVRLPCSHGQYFNPELQARYWDQLKVWLA